MPAQAGIQNLRITWTPAFAGMTVNGFFRTSLGYCTNQAPGRRIRRRIDNRLRPEHQISQ
ncbi:MAG: hypothetical protein CVV08_14475 [Gammaproteobacteria bacterium HGW-Gammaproteobacteria-12]|nr:MAG: hypothetical protein CVV08_14475 [Gammaproteobacteria bacterium HGW-Gammaproteobacteria-12]